MLLVHERNPWAIARSTAPTDSPKVSLASSARVRAGRNARATSERFAVGWSRLHKMQRF